MVKKVMVKSKTTRWEYFKYITWSNFKWNWLGGKLWYEVKSYWHLNVKKKGALWPDASQEDCDLRYCDVCGKGKK